MNSRKPLTLHALRALHAAGDKLAMLTCYDASFARVLDDAGVDVLLVGDSLGMVLQGQDSTLSVTLEDIAYHTRCVAAARRSAWLLADMPFGSYHQGVDQAVASAVTLMRAGAQMVKVEGGLWVLPLVRALVERGIPVCGHLGLTPQSVHALGGWRVQGRDEAGAERLLQEARGLADAGAAMLVLELMPSAVAAAVSQAVPGVMTIGIGAGPQVSGQVLVLHDLLGLNPGTPPRFVRNFMAEIGADDAGVAGGPIGAAVRRYVSEVKAGRYPDAVLHGY